MTLEDAGKCGGVDRNATVKLYVASEALKKKNVVDVIRHRTSTNHGAPAVFVYAGHLLLGRPAHRRHGLQECGGNTAQLAT